MKKMVEVIISDADLLRWFVDRMSPQFEASKGRERTLYFAMSYLVGITAKEAVEVANKRARNDGLPQITVKEFRKWFVSTFSYFAGSVILGDKEDD